MANLIEELEKLASLRDRGVLTPREFEQQKAALLGTSPALTSDDAPPPPDVDGPPVADTSGAPAGGAASVNFPDFPDFSPDEVAAPFSPGPRVKRNNTTLIVCLVVGGVLLLLIIVALAVGASRRSRPYYNAPNYYSSPPRYYPRTYPRSYPNTPPPASNDPYRRRPRPYRH